MKIALNQNIVLKFTLDKKPYAFTNGQLKYESNLNGVAYTIFDEHRDAPTGFGVKIAKTKKTYIIQRRVSGGKVIKAKVGNVSDFSNIDMARDKARNLIQVAKDTGQNPNAIARLRLASEITLSEAFVQDREHLLGRPTPAKTNSLKVFDKAVSKLKFMEKQKGQRFIWSRNIASI